MPLFLFPRPLFGLCDDASLPKVAFTFNSHLNIFMIAYFRTCSPPVLPVEDLGTMVERYFSPIENKNISIPTFPGTPYRPEQLAKRIHVVPVKELRSVELTFPLREISTLYQKKPMRYLSHLIGHEAKGSILALLRDKGWANDLSSGESRSNSDWSSFTINIDLTDEGLERVDDVVEIVFAYISLLREAGPQEWVHDETATVADVNFRFLSKRQPIDYTCSVASSMQIYPSEHILSGAYKIYEYGPGDIEECMSYLKPANAHMTVVSKTFEGTTDLKERWYGTDYKIDDLSRNVLDRWEHASAQSELVGGKLTLPERNDMIAEDFTIKDVLGIPKDEPRLLMDSSTCRCWFKPDNVFNMPKVNVIALLQTSLACESPESSVLAALWVQILNEHATEFTYLASMASLHCSFSVARKGIEIHVSGYNDKSSVLVGRILDAIGALAERLDEGLFERMKDKIEKQYKGFFQSPPYQHAMYAGDLSLETCKWSIEDKLQALERIRMAQVISFSRRLLDSFRLEMLVHGNCTPDEAKATAVLFVDRLNLTEPFEATLPAVRVAELKNGHDYYYRLPEFNPEDTNSCLCSIYQMGPMDLSTNAMLAFLHHLIKEPAFNELRTNEQLGYIVHAGIKTSGDDIKGLLFLIQSDGYNPIHLDERVEAFLHRFRSRLADMSADEFKSNISAVVSLFLEKNKNLSEESSKYWNVITNQSYIFRKHDIIGEEVRKLTPEGTLRFFDKYLAAGAPTRSKFAVQVFASQHQSTMDRDVPDESSLVSEPFDFKRTMHLFPLPAKVDVDGMKI